MEIASAQVAPVQISETAYFKGNNGTYQIPYQLINGTLKASILDLPAKELIFEINPTSNGQLTVVLPRTIIDSKDGNQDVPYFVSTYDIRSLGGPMRITPQELNDKDQRTVHVNFTPNISEIAIAGTWFVENNSTNPAHWNPFGSWSPLQQYNKGILAKDVKCSLGLHLVIKAEDDLPACVTPNTAQKLMERGWTKEIIQSTSPEKTSQDPLKLLLSINSTSIRPNQMLGIDITLNNTSPNFLVKDSKNSWPIEGLNMGPCELDPVGIGVYKGNYSLENVTEAKPLQLYQNGTYYCQMLVGVERYVFEPSSDRAVSEAGNGNSTGEMRYSASFHGFYTRDGFVRPPSGQYTVISGDRWGHLAIAHFTVANSTNLSVQNKISQALPSCASHIPHQMVFAGYAGVSLCPVLSFHMTSKMLNYSGFSGVYHTINDSAVASPSTYTNPLQEELDRDGNGMMDANLVLEPGHNGTITYQITSSIGKCLGSCPPGLTYPAQINETNIGGFTHRQANEILDSHDGLGVTYEPQSESLRDNQTVTLKATVTASKDVLRGTYWLSLTPGNCAGGPLILVTVTDCDHK